MYRSRISAPVLTAVAGLALITGCTADPAPTPEETGTASSTAVGTPDNTATASPTDLGASSAPTGSGATITLSRGQEHKITEANTSVSITCSDGGDIDVETSGASVQATGQCEDIDVDGNANSVTGEDSESLDIEGSNNEVTLRNVPDIDVDGTANTVGVEQTGDIDVEGENNSVTYTSGDPVIETEGTNSVAVR
ncbi:DUF3060 domain-containing protein [Arthrobacter zhaoxinii]|uniref:DUF3060 domain-containing protein n=1 Tax=Arthrobacter zhaoxinii TaxID=2964616 RepID=UPI002102E01B|nr:DUF3060 domain-containing protein [Arthrobacter zhaoxinii]MCQ2002197.1 DUF3060 domain-containing protein [Arthrobacter zhaoxinii]